MKNGVLEMFRDAFVRLLAFVAVCALVVACTSSNGDGFAGGTSEDAGIIADLNVAGAAQKGPFVKGSEVTVQGIDCKTMKLTGEKFEGEVKSDKGDFEVNDINLSSTCAIFEVSGYYMNEVTGEKTKGELTLRVATDLKNRKNVNVNILTNLEYERVKNLVANKATAFDDAKNQAEIEILAAFNVDSIASGVPEFEDLNIFEKGDGNATLLAVSVMMQGDENVDSLARRLERFADDFAEDGKWNDEKTKTEIAEWAAAAKESGKLDTIRKNVENMNDGEAVPEFESFVEKSSDALKGNNESSDNTKGSYLNPNVDYGEMTDSRDGQVYKTVKVGNQVWMAQNLNYADSVKTPSLKGKSWCYKDSSEYCEKYGRLYSWTAAMDSVAMAADSQNPQECGYDKICHLGDNVFQGVCPDGWHLPRKEEWETLIAEMGDSSLTGKALKATSGWNEFKGENGNGDDTYGFSALPAGRWYAYGKDFIEAGDYAYFWSSYQDTETSAYVMGLLYKNDNALMGSYDMNSGVSIRCLKDVAISNVGSEWSWDVPLSARFNPNIEYDTMVDPRDNQVYKIVKIAPEGADYSQVWMAQNLNYADTAQMPILKDQSWCYLNDEKNCEVSGRYYTWMAAIDSAALVMDPDSSLSCGYGKECGLARSVQGICPDGWHLPTRHELGYLIIALGNSEIAGRHLKSLTGWGDSEEGTGIDSCGFTALPVGRRLEDGSYQKVGTDDYFWSTSEYSAGEAEYMNMNNIYTKAYLYRGDKRYGQNVRCVKD